MREFAKDILVALVACVIFYYILVEFVGILAAIAMPDNYLNWFLDRDALKVGLYLHIHLVETIPGRVVPAFTLAFIATRFFATSWIRVCLAMVFMIIGHFWYQLFHFSGGIENLIKLNGYRVVIPSIYPLIFIFLGGWVGSRAKDARSKWALPIVISVFLFFCAFPFVYIHLIYKYL